MCVRRGREGRGECATHTPRRSSLTHRGPYPSPTTTTTAPPPTATARTNPLAVTELIFKGRLITLMTNKGKRSRNIRILCGKIIKVTHFLIPVTSHPPMKCVNQITHEPSNSYNVYEVPHFENWRMRSILSTFQSKV